MWQWERVFYAGRKRKYSLMIEVSNKRFLLGIGLERWFDWSGLTLYFGLLAIGVGIKHKLGY